MFTTCAFDENSAMCRKKSALKSAKGTGWMENVFAVCSNFLFFAFAIFLNLHQEFIDWMFGAMTQFVADASRIILSENFCFQ